MTPNAASPSSGPSGPSRRSFLASTAVATAAVAGGMPLLAACGGSDSGEREGTTSGKAADKLLPAFVASTVANPDLPSKNGSAAGYTGKVDLAALQASVPEKLGTGAPFKIMSPFWGSPPKADCAYYTALDAAAGTKITWQNQDGNTYGQKLGAVLASSSIPDMVVVPSWELVGKIANAVTAKFMDLGPYLAGDKIKKYPNLAAIPSDAWRMGIFGGALRGIPMPTATASGIAPLYRKDVFDEKGYAVPKSADEFMSWAKDATSAKAKVWACDGNLTWSAWSFFGVRGSGPIGWDMGSDGKLTYRIEQPEYLEALEWVRKVFDAGLVHPDDKARSGDAGQRFTAGQILVWNTNIADWYGKVSEQAQSNPDLKIEAMDLFGADGGNPKLYASSPASIWSLIRKGASKTTVENALAAANFAAAPYGTKERMLVDYGVEGTHYTVKDGVPVKNDLGNSEVINAWVMLAAPAAYYAHPDFPEVARKQVEWQQRMGAFMKKTSTFGMNIVEPTRYANLSSQFEQLEIDYVRGNRKLSDVQAAISTWKSSGGDKLRDWYKQLLDKNGSGA
ncbi:putative aldouronate transport system substrate-binding protein [Streptomyces sp. SAI-208]|uniref:extracellular solute-binding protein n=1 Tax=unclassified Streptomyces TaxID=2593676 RepID=UPI0024760824|nr:MULTISPECIES: extracellular solute-binding protein [unclassified Streptomyces]MDH6516145.1 putative aldouronate transport system substrate-binding protein [Streptomyces sp. SAI-090]MDH6548358.1 putative aldouronate transport system substrate-binding protein [Streptomyces sp. SAI-041]MDH6606969.1 putative aldouronate transport system substrate-binding protein [Streptomyces sp. SAI-208]MDH6619765.1 putative aldouronate transport system substrate-binding protein [Streptomyces sp. SAI-135]